MPNSSVVLMDVHISMRRVRSDVVVLHKLSDEIAACYQRSLACRSQSDLTSDPRIRYEFMKLERAWLKVIESLEFAENLDRYLRNGGRYQVNGKVENE